MVKWATKWFNEDYLLLYRHRNLDEATTQINLFIRTLKPQKTDRLLDAGCGTGRHVYLLDRMGYRIEGIDLSKTLIETGQKQYPSLRLLHGNIADIGELYTERYAVILSLFTSFGYGNRDENEALLRSIFMALQRGGSFWLDTLNAERIRQEPLLDTIKWFEPNIFVTEKRRLHGERLIKEIEITSRHLRLPLKRKKVSEVVYLYTKQALEALFKKVGLEVIYVFGNEKGDAWHPSAERTLIVGKKPPL